MPYWSRAKETRRCETSPLIRSMPPGLRDSTEILRGGHAVYYRSRGDDPSGEGAVFGRNQQSRSASCERVVNSKVGGAAPGGRASPLRLIHAAGIPIRIAGTTS